MSQVQHIVVVDDEQPAREMVGDYLRMHGFSVSLCDGGAGLRKIIAQQVPDLIVLDLNMPEEDGLSIIRDLKQRTSVPIIMLTATASAIDLLVTRQDDGIVVEVRDQGAGLSPEDISRLFGRFQRLSAKPTAGETSTGLGLSIVKRIVDLHGGRIAVESAGPGKGATFKMTLPVT